MRRVFWAVFVVVLILIIVVYMAAGNTNNPARLVKEIERNTGNNLYTIDAELDAKEKTLTATQSIRYVNNEDVALGEIYFHLYPNAFKTRETAPVLFDEFDRAYGNGFKPGSIELEYVQAVEGSKALPLKFSVSGPDSTTLRVELAGLILPKQAVTIDMKYKVIIPPALERFGYGKNHFNLGNWYPVAAVYDKQGWNNDRYYPIGDPFYSDIADYDVTIKAPSNFIIAAPGKLIEKQEQGDSTTWSYAANNQRDFAFVANSQFEVSEKVVDGTKIRSYYYTGDELRGKEALDIAAKSIQTFNEAYGKYPYQYYSVVETKFPSGMEYPGLVYISDAYYKLDNSYEYLAYTVVHETAHQWWYGVVGNDEVDEAWLDEGLTTYSEAIFIERQHGRKEAQKYAGYMESAANSGVNAMGFGGRILKPLDKFVNWADYGPAVYDKGAMTVGGLRSMVGDKAFFDIMRTYYKEYKFKNASTEGFIEVCEKVSKMDLRGYFRRMLEGI
jgi:hypothetical protein